MVYCILKLEGMTDMHPVERGACSGSNVKHKSLRFRAEARSEEGLLCAKTLPCTLHCRRE